MGSPAEAAKCTKCSEELDTTGYPLWCRKCRAAHKREYEQTRKEMYTNQAFLTGARTMRQSLAVAFDGLGGGQFSGGEISDLILRAPLPTTDQAP
jgi:hypothetical protein